jgi:LytS/YehU family sensor histidine kinase
MRNRPVSIYIGGASILYGILVFLYIYRKENIFTDSLLIAFVFSVILFFVLLVLHTKTIKKLKVFSGFTSVFLQSFLYVLALSFSLLITFIFYTIYSTSAEQIENFLIDGLLKGFLYLITLPFSDQKLVGTYYPEIQSLLYTFFVIIFLIGLVSLLSSFIEVRWREVKQNQLITNAELKALQAQIEPHFLFNSLNTIVSIVKSNPEKAEDLLIKLSDLLHYIFSTTHRMKMTLKEEINFTKNYLSLMQERFSDNLIVEWNENIPKDDIEVPSLICQPLIENAIKHGWKDKSKKFKLNIVINTNQKSVECVFQDNGIGIQAEKLKSLPEKGHALFNLNERLFLEYRGKDLLQIKSEPGNGTIIELKIPLK